MIHGNGKIYEGEWFEGKMHGHGKLTIRDDEYIGLFRNNEFIQDESD